MKCCQRTFFSPNVAARRPGKKIGRAHFSISFSPAPALELPHQDFNHHQVLGSSRLHPHPGTRNRPLRRQHLLRRSPFRQRHHHPRFRHRPAPARHLAAKRIQDQAAQSHAPDFPHPLGSHPRPALLRAHLRIPLPPPHPRWRRRQHQPRLRPHRPDGKHLFPRAVLEAPQQHRD